MLGKQKLRSLPLLFSSVINSIQKGVKIAQPFLLDLTATLH